MDLKSQVRPLVRPFGNYGLPVNLVFYFFYSFFATLDPLLSVSLCLSLFDSIFVAFLILKAMGRRQLVIAIYIVTPGGSDYIKWVALIYLFIFLSTTGFVRVRLSIVCCSLIVGWLCGFYYSLITLEV